MLYNESLPVYINTQRILEPKMDVYYPKVYGIHDKMIELKINNEILNQTNKLIELNGGYEKELQEMVGAYELKTNERQILSLLLFNYAFLGGAHGMTYNKSLTFDITTCKNYELKDLFKEGSDYQKVLSEIVGEQIKERKIPLIGDYEGIRPNQDFYIADKSLVIYFQLYELAPYAYGFQYFPISIYEIQDIIDEDGPLGKMLG